MGFNIRDDLTPPVNVGVWGPKPKSELRLAVEGLKVGQSIIFPANDPVGNKKRLQAMAGSIHKATRNRKHFTVRQYNGGIGVWRIV